MKLGTAYHVHNSGNCHMLSPYHWMPTVWQALGITAGAACIPFLVLCHKGMHLRDACVASLNMANYIHGFGLLLSPVPEKGADIAYIVMRGLASLLLFMLPLSNYHSYSHFSRNALVWAVFSVSALSTQFIARRVLQPRQCHVLGVLHGLATTCISLQYIRGDEAWWYYPLISIVPQLCVFLPSALVNCMRNKLTNCTCNSPATTAALQRSKQQGCKQQCTHAQGSGGSTKGPADACCSCSVGVSSPAKEIAHADCFVTRTSDVGPGGTQGIDLRCEPHHASSALILPFKVPRRPSIGSMIRDMQNNTYSSKLGTGYKVHLKLATDLSHTSLPANMAQHMQEALNCIGGVTLRISELAVRPGCIMITLNIRDASSANEQQAPALPPQQVAQALLGCARQVLDAAERAEGRVPCDTALVQINQQHAAASWSASHDAWQLQQLVSRTGTIHAEPAQVWGFLKLDVVEGWTPPGPGKHEPSAWQLAAAAHTGNDVHEDTGSSSKQFRLLARIGSSYLVTHVQQTLRPTSNGSTILHVVIDLPLSYLVRHHPGGVPSSLLLLSLELWEGEVFLSSSPLISLSQAVTSGAGLNSSAWWWGASEGVVTAAMTEMEALACGLTSMDQEGSSGPVASHSAFMEDVSTWLLGVQATAQACQHCTAGQHGRQASSQLTPAALKPLGEGLQEYAGSIGMHSLRAMLVRQQRAQGLRCRPATTSIVRAKAGAWLSDVQEVLIGSKCSMCEAKYKLQLGAYLISTQPKSSLLFALYGLTAITQMMYRTDYACLSVVVAWTLLHAAGAVHAMMPLRTAQQERCQSVLVWTLGAYFVRLTTHWLYALQVLSAPVAASRLFQARLVWAITHLLFALVEQTQSSVMLPAGWITSIAVFIDLPCVLVRALREGGWWGECVLLAPLVVVVARLVLDAHMRGLLHLKHSGHGAKSKGMADFMSNSVHIKQE